jgi:hypothetical protein
MGLRHPGPGLSRKAFRWLQSGRRSGDAWPKATRCDDRRHLQAQVLQHS